MSRVEHTQAAALDHGRAAHADVAVGRGDDHIAAPEDGRVAGEAVTGVDAHHRHQARQLGEVPEGEAVEAAHAGHVGVARSPSPTLGEEHHRGAQLLGEREQAILLAVVLPALRAGEHRVVVAHRDHRVSGHLAEPSDHPVGRRAGDQVVDVAPAALGCDHHRAVLHEAALVDQVGDVLAGRAPVRGSPPGHRVGSGGVEAHVVAGDGLRQVGPD
jgi:hypothetical protein